MTGRVSEEAIRPAALMADKAALVVADRDYLLKRRDEWVEVPCPACSSIEFAVWGEKNGFRYRLCDACATVYTSPRPTPAVLEDFYRQSQNYAYWNEHVFPATEDARREQIFRPRADRVAELCREREVRDATLLEVGAGFGTFCEVAAQTGVFARVVALEPTPGLAETCRAKGFEVLEQPLERVEADPFADVVVAFEVLEHTFDPLSFLAQCTRLLHPGGLLVVTCPNVRGFDVAALGVQSHTVDHEHLNYLHPDSLRVLLERAGLEVVAVTTPGRLDADIVRRRALEGAVDLEGQPLLKAVLLDRWEDLGGPFQDFLATHGLSSHMWAVAATPG